MSNPGVCRYVPMLIAAGGVSAVACGAFGAHALRSQLDPQAMQVWHTAVNYHFWHVLAMSLAAVAAQGRARTIAIRAFFAGVILFSGSLYALALGAPHVIGIITPCGGVAFMIGWIALGLGLRPRTG